MISYIDKIKKLSFVEKLYCFDVIDSTNNFAKTLITLPKAGLYIINAKKQTKGRGQRNNKFFSNQEGGIYTTIICPINDITLHFNYNRAISLSICQSIKKIFPDAPIFIKWPNDIYWKDKKLGGILLENHLKSPNHLIIGFGININLSKKDFPANLRNIATSIKIETTKICNKEFLLFNIVNLFWKNVFLDTNFSHSQYCDFLYKVGCECEINNLRGIFKQVLEDGRAKVIHNNNESFYTSGPIKFIN
jgi:BirA family biotin operon repressor/biotin-[acetyl-CoA-carboxylase] ligase